jgi:hypothetical protein
MLAWSGAFGLLGSAYWAGRPAPETLFSCFAAWSFSLVLLLVVVVHEVRARARRVPALPELAILFGFGLAVCSLGQIPTPWSQLTRLRQHGPSPAFEQSDARRFVASVTRRGERVELLTPLGFRVAYELGLVNVSPYSSIESMPTRQQLSRAIAALRAAHASKLFVPSDIVLPEELRMLRRAGFSERESSGDVTELVDDRAGETP